MGTEGIDDVLACQRDDKDDTLVYTKDMYNPQDQSTYRINKCNEVSCNSWLHCGTVHIMQTIDAIERVCPKLRSH